MARNKQQNVATTTNTAPIHYGIDALMSCTGRLVPLHPVTMQPMETWLELVGVDSDEFDAAVRSMVKNLKTLKIGDLSEDEIKMAEDDRTRELAARCITDWDTVMFGPFSSDAAVKLMLNRKAKWLFVQVQKFLEDHANFYKA